jgi:hypothetical protein
MNVSEALDHLSKAELALQRMMAAAIDDESITSTRLLYAVFSEVREAQRALHTPTGRISDDVPEGIRRWVEKMQRRQLRKKDSST